MWIYEVALFCCFISMGFVADSPMGRRGAMLGTTFLSAVAFVSLAHLASGIFFQSFWADLFPCGSSAC